MNSFVSIGAPVKDVSHPDYIPSKFVYHTRDDSKSAKKLSRFASAKKRQAAQDQLHADAKNERKHAKICEEFSSTTERSESSISSPLQSEEETGESQNIEVDALKEEIEKLRGELTKKEQLLKNAQVSFPSYKYLKTNSKKFLYYTGIAADIFEVIFNFLCDYITKDARQKLSLQDQLLLALMKLRLNLQFETLADLFKVSKSTVGNIFWTWVNAIYSNLSFLIAWPDHEASIKTLPTVFKQYFPCLTGIIDCTEIFIDRPKNLKARAKVYSNYKKHSTIKFLIACTPYGSISFLSKAWGGRVSDVELVKRSGFISPNLHHHGDQVLADRGFNLVDEFASGCGTELIIPHFTRGKKQLSPKEVETTRQIASIRIHIERVIGILKNRYKILQGPLPIRVIKSVLDETRNEPVSAIDKILTVCAILVNLGESIVYNDDKKLQK